MDGETWQSNLESWRERRRAAARALSLELQQHSDGPSTVESTIKTNNGPQAIDIPSNLRKLKTPNTQPTKFDDHVTPQRDVKGSKNQLSVSSDAKLSSDLLKPSLNMKSDAPEKFGEFTKSHKRPTPTRIRLIYLSDCMEADHMGISVAALGDGDGPPFVIHTIVKNSVADKSHLEVGDELISVDNLCCSFADDRPVIISTLAKLHQLLHRLSTKRRPVEVKVFRGYSSCSRDGESSANPSVALKVNELPTCRGNVDAEVAPQSSCALSNCSSMLRLNGSKPSKKVSPESSEITLVELEKIHPLRSVQQFISSTERVEADCLDTQLVHTIPPLIEMASTLITIQANVDLSRLKAMSQITANQFENSGAISGENYTQPVSEVHGNVSEAQSLTSLRDTPTLPPSPQPPSSDVLLPSLLETIPSICAISPPPLPLLKLRTASHDQCPPISLIPAPLPPLSPPATGENENSMDHSTYEESINLNQSTCSSFRQDQGYSPPSETLFAQQDPLNTVDCEPMILLQTPSQQSIDGDAGTQFPKCTQISVQISNTLDLLQNDASKASLSSKNDRMLEFSEDAQYNSDASSVNGEAFVELIPSNHVSKGDIEVAHSDVLVYSAVSKNGSLSESDIDSDNLSHSKQKKDLERADTKLTPLQSENATDHLESMHLTSIEGKETKQRCSPLEVQDYLKPVFSCTKTETLMAETVAVDTLHSLEGNPDSNSSILPTSPSKRNQATEFWVREPDRAKDRQTKMRSPLNQAPCDKSHSHLSLPPPRSLRVNVIGSWYTCAGCNEQLGASDLMIIEQLSLFYHLSCFVCARCGIQLSDGQNETSVRVRNGLLYCYICYHRISKSLSHSKERNEAVKPNQSPNPSERYSSLRGSHAEKQLIHTSPQCKSNGFEDSLKR